MSEILIRSDKNARDVIKQEMGLNPEGIYFVVSSFVEDRQTRADIITVADALYNDSESICMNYWEIRPKFSDYDYTEAIVYLVGNMDAFKKNNPSAVIVGDEEISDIVVFE